jgi:hypothetical protein
MRILNLTEFRAMPEGTIFKQASEPFAFDDWCIKGETWETDFVSSPMDWPENNGSEALLEALNAMWEDSSVSRPLAFSYGRDGRFEYDAKFMVLEKADLSLLRDAIDFAMSLPSPQQQEMK